ncbi:3-deoxy-D-manno-octulosonate 8-phosphate phosphatase, partial [bacterium]|nr:3-deoxy-D-manno-octulosonate 8-phosphate phosphatase [bacterium]
MEQNLKEKLKNVKILALDVDGVMTDRKIVWQSNGDELKFFNAHDGAGIKMLMNKGVVVVIISGRKSKCTDYRAKELGIKEVYQGVSDKLAVIQKLLVKYNVSMDNVVYIGDDIPDLDVIKESAVEI